MKKKKSITKTREKRGRRKVWALGVCEQSLVFQWTGRPVERSAISLSCSTDTIWRGLYCLKLWVNDIWGAGVRHDSPASPPDPKSSCEREPSNFSAFSNGSSNLPLPPSLIHSLPPSISLRSLSLSLFFSLFLRHSLVTAWSSNRTTLFLTRTGSPEIRRGAPWVPAPKMKKKKVVL